MQASLDEFRIWWNQHTIRRQANKDMPSGHVPQDAVDHPEMFGGIDCLIQVPHDVIDDLRQYLTEEVGPRDQFLQFYPYDFEPVASQAYQIIGSPQISLITAWSVFTKMSDVIEAGHLY